MIYMVGGVFLITASIVVILALYGRRSVETHEEMREDD